jgi:hypothetical protein
MPHYRGVAFVRANVAAAGIIAEFRELQNGTVSVTNGYNQLKTLQMSVLQIS